MPAASGNHPIETPVRPTLLKIGTTTATEEGDELNHAVGGHAAGAYALEAIVRTELHDAPTCDN